MDEQNKFEPQTTPGEKPLYGRPGSTVPQLNIGSIISRSLSILMKKPSIFLSLTVIAALAPVLVQIALYPSTSGAILAVILRAILGMLIQATVAYAVFQIARGRAVSVDECLARAARHFLPILLASLLVGLLVGIGMFLLIIPGVIVSCVLAVTLPACVVEKLQAVDSLKRSADLTKGNRLQIFLLFLVVGVLIGGITLLFALLVIGVTGFVAGSLLLGLFLVLPLGFSYVMASLIYFDLREIKESMPLDSLAEAFD